uniref:Uncharacterized protein n=1 Tax=Rhizochromulina marina TaxID=1034831 RepID=A0A7S2R8P2_9STRA|mmetsp:Transcript_12695/g.36784  ORF Transcript_12695/g.36784 Transcript_12695/m.36784 type:complete len:194 (+) Transcript_12695:93-674(+)
MDEQEIIRRDQEQHPECSYSISSSQSCQMVNGETSCETIRRVLRLCPSQAPCEIFRNKETTQRDAGAEAPLFGTPGMAGRLPQDDMEKEMQGMLKEFSRHFGMFGLGGIGDGMSPGSVDPRSPGGGGHGERRPRGFSFGPPPDMFPHRQTPPLPHSSRPEDHSTPPHRQSPFPRDKSNKRSTPSAPHGKVEEI